MPGDFSTYLLDAQAGDEAAFACLYEATNPVLVRLLRVVADGDASDLAITAWATLVRRLPTCPPDDEAWLEHVVDVARLTAEDARLRAEWSSVVDAEAHRPLLALADLESPAPAAAPPAEPASEASGDPEAAEPAAEREPDAIDRAVAAVRAVGGDEARALALVGIASLEEDGVARALGVNAATSRELLAHAEAKLGTPVEHLAALRAPARSDEVADLPVVLGLFTAGASHPPALATAAAAVGPLAAVGWPTVVEIPDPPVVPLRARTTGHAARQVVGWAAASVLVVAGVAASYSGFFGGPDARTPNAAEPRASAPGGGTGGGTGTSGRGGTGTGGSTSGPAPQPQVVPQEGGRTPLNIQPARTGAGSRNGAMVVVIGNAPVLTPGADGDALGPGDPSGGGTGGPGDPGPGNGGDPGTAGPGTGKPTPARPGVARPSTAKPGTSKPDSGKPGNGNGRPGAGQGNQGKGHQHGRGHGKGHQHGRGHGKGHGQGHQHGRGHGKGHGQGHQHGRGHGKGHGQGHQHGRGHGKGHGQGHQHGRGHGKGHAWGKGHGKGRPPHTQGKSATARSASNAKAKSAKVQPAKAKSTKSAKHRHQHHGHRHGQGHGKGRGSTARDLFA